MLDVYLKAADEQALIDTLPGFRGEDEDGVAIWLGGGHSFALDLVGALYNDDALMNEDGTIDTPATALPGYHANLRLLDENLLSSIPESIIITEPNNPKRRFF